MILYLDASSMAKLYIEEPGSSAIEEAVLRAKAITTSRITYAEVRAAIARARRNKRLSDWQHRASVDKLAEDWGNAVIIDVTQDTVESAGDLAERYPLRGFDSVHLACALTARGEVSSDLAFSSFDSNLLTGARAEGLVIVG